jgi:hypothetical protein
VTPTQLRPAPTPRAGSARALRIGSIALSTFGTIGGIVGVLERDLFEALLGFADILLGGIVYLHTKAAR